MPGKVAVKIKSGRNLPVMDKSSDTTDAYVEIKLGNVTYKTDVCRKSLNPQWNTDWFRFEVEDADLQDEPLQIRLMDHDTYSANDAIGKVNINLNPLCKETFYNVPGKVPVFSGWIPVFDTLHGIRGEVNVIVKVDLFSDVNKFRQSSCGIPFFHSQCIPYGYKVKQIHGFVEELIVNDDPEYQWIDKIRTPRASNEVRQVVFLKLSGQVQRKMGLKATNMGANAVIGYSQYFDLEGDVGVVARGIGTAVTLLPELSNSQVPEDNNNNNIQEEESMKVADVTNSPVNTQSSLKNTWTPSAMVSNSKGGGGGGGVGGEMCRRSSDSDINITPKVNPFNNVPNENGSSALMKIGQNGIKMEYPFFTMTSYPNGFILHIGATVSARSVKLLERIPNQDQPELRDLWWSEIRMEIRSHARSLGCNVVLGYSELTTISDDVCVLSATGTAAIINMLADNCSTSYWDIYNNSKLNNGAGGGGGLSSASLEDKSMIYHHDYNSKDITSASDCSVSDENHHHHHHQQQHHYHNQHYHQQSHRLSCSLCHIPKGAITMPLSIKMKKCGICKRGRVPDVLLATFELPETLQVNGRGCFLQAQVVRMKKDLRAEMNAKEISDGLPFLEYELHRVLINKLKARGMNAIFGLRVEVAIGERVIALLATGTALFLTALPMPQVPQIIAGNSWTDKQRLIDLQKKLQEIFENSQEKYQVKTTFVVDSSSSSLALTDGGGQPPPPLTTMDKYSDTDNSDEEINEIDLTTCGGKKDACILEVDGIEDIEIISLLLEPTHPDKLYVVNTQQLPGMIRTKNVKNCQLFTQMWKAKLESGQAEFQAHFQRLLQIIFFKLRTLLPCAICNLQFKLDFPDNDQIQLLVMGMALGLNNDEMKPLPSKGCSQQSSTVNSINDIKQRSQDDYCIFSLDEENVYNSKHETSICSNEVTMGIVPQPPSSSTSLPQQQQQQQPPNPCGINITTQNMMPRGKIDKYLGNLNFFFIRENTSIRENGGISAFVHGFLTELLAIVRAHIVALGGNGMVAFNLTELNLLDNQHKNQGQCLISIGGDAVRVSYAYEQP